MSSGNFDSGSGFGVGDVRRWALKVYVLRVTVKPPLGKERGTVGTSVLHTADLENEYEIQA